MPLTENDINQQFQKVLGRTATSSEIQDFLRFGGTGYIDLSAEDVGNILQGFPEVRQKQLESFGGQLEQRLGAGDTTLLGKAQDLLTQQFAQQGRSGSSGYISAFANAARDLALQRQQTLANFYGGGLQQIFGETGQRASGTRALGVGSLEAAKQRQFSLEDQASERAFQLNYLNKLNAFKQSQSRRGGIGSIFGGLAGAGLGLALAPTGFGGLGALLGAQFGQGLGGLFSSSQTPAPTF